MHRGCCPGQDGLDDGRLQQRQPQQLIDRRMVQPLLACNIAAAGNQSVVQQLGIVVGS